MLQKISFVVAAIAMSVFGIVAGQSTKSQGQNQVQGQSQAQGQIVEQLPSSNADGQTITDAGMKKNQVTTLENVTVIGEDVSTEKAAAVAHKIMGLYGSSSGLVIQASVVSGTIAIGVIIEEKDGELFLDREPCNKKVETFRKPYRSSPLGKKQKCGDKEFELHEVRQQ